MEDCYNYNRIIEAIEENIEAGEKELYELAANAAGLSRREAALIVKSVEGEDYSMYIKRRKIIRCAQYKLTNPDKTWVDIAAEFSMFEYSTFNRRFKAFLGITPDNFPKGLKTNVMEMKPGYISKDNVIVKTETIKKTITETITETVLVEKDPEVIYVRNHDNVGGKTLKFSDIAALTEGKSGHDNTMGMMLKDAFGIGSYTAIGKEQVKKRIAGSINADSDVKGLLEAYDTIIELEEIRAIYGLSIEEVLYLYIKAGKNSIALFDKCERICDERIEELYAEDMEDLEDPYWEEWREELANNELSISEAYAYYQGEDEMEYDDEEEFDNNSIKHMYW